jgi:hypothetical protein
LARPEVSFLAKDANDLVDISPVVCQPAAPPEPAKEGPRQGYHTADSAHRAAAHGPFVLLQSLVVRPKSFEHEVAEFGLAQRRFLPQEMPPGPDQLVQITHFVTSNESRLVENREALREPAGGGRRD